MLISLITFLRRATGLRSRLSLHLRIAIIVEHASLHREVVAILTRLRAVANAVLPG
jgi:hypothetical protein